MTLNNIIKAVLSIPKTVVFNLRHLPIEQAIKLPIWVCYNTSLSVRGRVIIDSENIKPLMCKIGFFEVPNIPNAKTKVLVGKNAKLIIKGGLHLGRGSVIVVTGNGVLTFGRDFAISSSSTIICYNQISFGNNVLLGWECLIQDCDSHKIYDKNGVKKPTSKPIMVGNKVWLTCRVTVLKGTIIPDNCVVSACSLVVGNKTVANSIIAGSPGVSVKEIQSWEI